MQGSTKKKLLNTYHKENIDNEYDKTCESKKVINFIPL